MAKSRKHQSKKTKFRNEWCTLDASISKIKLEIRTGTPDGLGPPATYSEANRIPAYYPCGDDCDDGVFDVWSEIGKLVGTGKTEAASRHYCQRQDRMGRRCLGVCEISISIEYKPK